MITRRRYNVPVKRPTQEASPGFDVHVGRSSVKEPPPHPTVRGVAEENWWTDWRSTTLVIGLVAVIAVGLYLVKGKEVDYGATPAYRPPPSATASSSPPPPPSSPRRHAAGGGYSAASVAPGDADSFLAFSRTARAGREGPAMISPPAGNPVSPAGAASVLSHGDRKIVLPDKLSGECKVGGASIDDFLKGLGDCFSRRSGGV